MGEGGMRHGPGVVNLLIFEDSPFIVRALEKMLSSSGACVFRVQHVSNLAAGIALLEKQPCDAVLLDLNLSDSAGMDTLTGVTRRYPHLPVVVVTGAYEEKFGIKAVANGAQDYLVKGNYDAGTLMNCIYYAIERKGAERALARVNECFLGFGSDAGENIDRIVATAGDVLDGAFSLYEKEEGAFLYTQASWNLPQKYDRKRIKTGGLCQELITSGSADPRVIDESGLASYRESDPAIVSYALKTCAGCAVPVDGQAAGALCVWYYEQRSLRETEKTILSILARAVGIEERRRGAEKKKKETEKKYKLLFDNSHDAIFLTDKKSFRLLDVNRKAESLLGKTRQELIGMHCSQLYPDRRPFLMEGETGYGEEKRAEKVETEVMSKGGNKIPVEVSTALIMDDDRDILQQIFTDMSGLRTLQRELVQSGKMAEMGQLIAGVCHELKQPLTGIRGFAQAALADLAKDNPVRSDLEKILEQAGRMDTIIKNIRLFARKSDFVREEIDVNKPINDSLMLLSQQLRLHNIKVNLFCAAGLPRVKGDPNQLQQVFLNMISNAQDAIEHAHGPRGGELTIRTFLSDDGACVTITFQDTGCGIPRAQLENIFQPFFTTKPTETGTGLGLSIVSRIIEYHGGTIKAESEEGQGTLFRIALPVVS